MARKFLYIVAFLTALVIVAAFVFRIWGNELIRWRFVPRDGFQPQAALPADAYAKPDMWLARPDKKDNPALWTPKGFSAGGGKAAVFFIHPTSYLEREHWNAPLADREANRTAELYLRGQASVFNAAGQIWAPRYRQATFGAFLTNRADAARALDLAYGDVLEAFDTFLKQIGPHRPIILAGHSQGGLHLTRLLKDRVAGTPLAKRIVAAYVIGWPVSRSADLPAMGLPECLRPDQRGCVLSWQSFAEPADPRLILDTFDGSTGLTGQPRRGTRMVCTNPLTGRADTDAPASANLGTLFPTEDMSGGKIEAGKVPARCAGRGFLLIGEPPQMGSYVLPGNNYHVYDYALFWANIRADAARRMRRR